MIDTLIKYAKNNTIVNNFEILTNTEKLLETHEITNEYIDICDEYFKLLPFSNINISNKKIYFDTCVSKIINKIFKQEVTNEYLIISTPYEHDIVQENLKDKNVCYLNTDDIRQLNFNKIKQQIKNYKKIFVYIIGTQVATGEITPQIFFEKLRKLLIKENKEFTFVLDDTHGMFLVPRDYSMFDYIIGTACAFIHSYDLGIIISKNSKYGFTDINKSKEYLKKLKLILSHKNEILQFKNIIIQELFNYIYDSVYFRLFNHTSNHIFAAETKNLYFSKKDISILNDYFIIINENPIYYNFIGIRFQDFITLSPEKIKEGLNILCNILEKAILINKMKIR